MKKKWTCFEKITFEKKNVQRNMAVKNKVDVKIMSELFISLLQSIRDETMLGCIRDESKPNFSCFPFFSKNLMLPEMILGIYENKRGKK